MVSHARSASGDLAAFLHAVELAAAAGLVSAHHIVIIVVLAAGPDEKGGAHQRSGARADLLDFGDVVGERGRVDEDLLVESGPRR